MNDCHCADLYFSALLCTICENETSAIGSYYKRYLISVTRRAARRLLQKLQ
jgi:hypothetical protein